KKLQIVAVGALSLGIAGLCSAQSDAPYTEGPVWNVTMVKTKTGMTDEYLKGLAKTLKASLEEAKKQNLVVDYKILLGSAATPQDFDILVMVESKNMAAQDNTREKFDPIARKVVGTTDQQQSLAVKRLDIREIIGTKLMREITLKKFSDSRFPFGNIMPPPVRNPGSPPDGVISFFVRLESEASASTLRKIDHVLVRFDHVAGLIVTRITALCERLKK